MSICIFNQNDLAKIHNSYYNFPISNKNGKNIEKQNKNSVKNRKTKQKCGKKNLIQYPKCFLTIVFVIQEELKRMWKNS